jgi:hypothetical protein
MESQTSVQAGRPRSGPAGAEGLDCLAGGMRLKALVLMHRRGAWRPHAHTLGLSHEGARMRPKVLI